METTASVNVYEVWAAQCVNRSCGASFTCVSWFSRLSDLGRTVASLTFLVWDILTTWDEELAFIWWTVTPNPFYFVLGGSLDDGLRHDADDYNHVYVYPYKKAADMDPLPLCLHSVRPNSFRFKLHMSDHLFMQVLRSRRLSVRISILL